MGGDAGFCGKLDSAFDGGEGKFAEDIDGLKDESSRAADAEKVGQDFHFHNIGESFFDTFDERIGPVGVKLRMVVVVVNILLAGEDG